ncbi:sigma-70 family RNA polymerase sigma factor [Tumidithrix elongata RA019]|uniref:Sigma-70 family RNA polymerase sigma factor n=1 Tax=Tumidithrix elongata BACA0141 TaxID=2716417 RepID=A0AAW9Q787_9CYAN|nr:sigma-70 family RNA polymerase sigma factor [Tumidithrix elongata RA019]
MLTNPPIDEISVLERIASQDQAALSLLYDRYARVIYTIAYRIIGSAEESEEIVLDVFTQVWRIAKNYTPQKGRVDTWLFMIARSRALDRIRSRTRSYKAIEASEHALLLHSHADSPEEDVLVRERSDYVKAALEKLPSEQRLVLELAYFKGLSHTQIAVETGISLGTIKTRIRLGLKKLRESLGEEWCSF